MKVKSREVTHVRIGELAERAGTTTRALRYYEEQGLLAPGRTSSGQRVYDDTAVDRVRLIRQLFTAGLNSQVIASLLPAIENGRLDPDLLDRLDQEQTRLADAAAELRDSGLRLGLLIELARKPHAGDCPASLDAALPATEEQVTEKSSRGHRPSLLFRPALSEMHRK